MTRTYGSSWCGVCGEWITSAGAARTSHLRKHVRAGLMIEHKIYDKRGDCHFEFKHAPGVPYKSWKKNINEAAHETA